MKQVALLALLLISIDVQAFLANGSFWTGKGSVIVSKVVPESGTGAGGLAVTISGLGFKPGATVTIDGVTCASPTVVNQLSLTCVTGADSNLGLKNVVVTNADATTGTLVGGFAYIGSPAFWAKADALALSDGASVNTWTDSSGNGFHATYASAAAPVYKAAVTNGKPVVRFSGQFMNSTLPLANVLKNTMFVVYNPTAGGAALGGSACCSPSFILALSMFGTAGTGYTVKNATNAQSSVGNYSTTELNTFTVAAGRFNSLYPLSDTGTAIDSYSNGVHYVGSMTGVIGTDPTYLEIGARGGGANIFTGDMAEIVVYPTALSDANVTAVQCYLGHKYGFSVTGC